MRFRRVLTIMLIVIAAVVLIDSGVRLYGFASAASNGVTIHTEATATLDAPATVSFDYESLSPLLCSTACEATLMRHDTGEIIARENRSALTGASIEAGIADASSLKRVPVQLRLSCETQASRYCSRASQTAADLSIVSFSLDEEDAERRETLISRKDAIETRISSELETLSGLAKLEGPYEELATRAERELAGHLEAIAAYRDSIEAERYDAEPPQPPISLRTWDRELEAARGLENTSASTADRMSRLSRYRELLGDDRDAFAELGTAYREQNRTAIEANETLASIDAQLAQLEARYGARIRSEAYTNARNTGTQLTAACRIYTTTCPEGIERPESIEQAEELSEGLCSLAQTYTSEAKRALAESLNLTLEQARASYDVTGVENASTFPAFESSAIENASRGPVNLTIAERLAIDVPIEASFCNETAYEPIELRVPELDMDEYEVTLTIRGPHMCAFGSCDVEPKTPIVFIHGHSFAEGSDPTANLETMTDLALALEDYGYLYAGHLFPGSEREMTIDAPASFTATYYLNSYVEDGTVRFTSFKSEPIESYAIRLKEDIENARSVTGADQVVIVAHSMGGLVARSYLDLFGEERVKQLIMIGTPNAGITDRAQRLCPVFGAGLECRDMTEGSVFLRKLNSGESAELPMHVIAGTGCDGGDGIVELESALLDGANATVITGSCSGLNTLHAKLIEPDETPLTVTIIADLLQATERTRNLLE